MVLLFGSKFVEFFYKLILKKETYKNTPDSLKIFQTIRGILSHYLYDINFLSTPG